MRLRHLKYLAAYSIPTVVIVSMVLGGSYAFLAIGYVFVAVPFIELFTSGKTVNLSKLEEEVASKDKILILTFLKHFSVIEFKEQFMQSRRIQNSY